MIAAWSAILGFNFPGSVTGEIFAAGVIFLFLEAREDLFLMRLVMNFSSGKMPPDTPLRQAI